MRVLREPVEEAFDVLVQERVSPDAEPELVELGARGQVPVDEQVRRLEEAGRVALDEVLDGDAAVAQDALVAVDERDRGLGRAGVDVSVVERDEAGLGPQLRDVDRELVLGASHHREVDLLVTVAELGRRLAHVFSSGLGRRLRNLSRSRPFRSVPARRR